MGGEDEGPDYTAGITESFDVIDGSYLQGDTWVRVEMARGRMGRTGRMTCSLDGRTEAIEESRRRFGLDISSRRLWL